MHRHAGSFPYSHVSQGFQTSPTADATEAADIGPQQPLAAAPSLEGMLNFITRNKITEGRPVRSKLADGTGSKTAAGMKWIQPSGKPF